MAVPGNDAAGFDRKLAEAQLALPDVRGLLFEVDGGKHGVGHSLARTGDRRARVGFDFVGRAFASDGRRQTGDSRTRDNTRQNKASAKSAAVRDAIEHVGDLPCYARPQKGPQRDPESVERRPNGNAEWLLNR